MLGSLASHLRYALIIILVVVTIILLSKWTGSGGRTALLIKGGSKQQQQKTDSAAVAAATTSAAVQKLMKESQEWAGETEHPSITPVAQLINATYALAYAQATQALATSPDIKSATSVDVEPLVANMKAKQTEAVQYLASNFPSIV